MDVGFVLDSSANVREAVFRGEVLPFVQKLEGRLYVGVGNTRVGIVQYGGRPRRRLSVDFLQYPETRALQRKTGSLDYLGGDGNLKAAIAYADKHLFRYCDTCGTDNSGTSARTSKSSKKSSGGTRSSDSKSGKGFDNCGNRLSRHFNAGVRSVMFVISDGHFSEKDPTKKALDFKARGGIVVAVGVGPDADENILENIGSRGLTFIVRNPSELSKYVDKIIHTLLPNPCPLQCTMDMATLLDSSDSSFPNRTFYSNALPFLSKLQGNINVRGTGTHVAMVQYGKEVVPKWNLLRYLHAPTLMRQSLGLQQLGGLYRQLNAAVRYASNKVLSCPCIKDGSSSGSGSKSTSSEGGSRRGRDVADEPSFFDALHHYTSRRLGDEEREGESHSKYESRPPSYNKQARCDPSAPRVMLVVYGGKYSGRDPLKTAAEFKKGGGVVVAIAVGPGVNRAEVNKLASPGMAYFVSSFRRLEALAVQVAKGLACV